jgi:uncharacterized protein (UPF0276 family)
MVFLTTHAPVGYQWQNTGLHPDCSVVTNTRATSCRTQTKKLARAIRVPVLLENTELLPFEGYDFEVRSERIAEVLQRADCGFVLDIGHARVSAAALGMNVHDYLDRLPLDRVVQIHVSGPRVRNGRLADVHEPLQEIDYTLLDFVLARTHPRVVTLEYIRERGALRAQLFCIRDILGSHGGAS